MKKKQPQSLLTLLPAIIIALVAVMFYMAGDGSYRYPCQDPSNFTNPSCHPPACLAAEYCTDMLINLGETE
jgi:hypothetical protein